MTDKSYESAGVRDQGDALSSVRRHLGPTLSFPEGVEVITDFGHYASVIKINPDLAIAISTDGVGSKTIVASKLDRYDTIGSDCVAMNANDIICIGARPFAMVDYLGVHTLDTRRADAILKGLGAAAKEAGIAIPGGELAQLPEVIGSDGTSPGDPSAFDLVGTCIGTLHPDRMITGSTIEVGDVLIGVVSSGVHSNGLTLARRVLLDKYDYDQVVPDLGRTLGEELLEPTVIYVRAATALWDASIETRGLAHITSDGFTNLCRLEAEVGYRITELPPTPPIFDLISSVGGVEAAEMYKVFNMGIGFVAIVPEDSRDRAIGAITGAGYEAQAIGIVTDRVGVVEVEPAGLVGRLTDGRSSFSPV